MVCCKFLVFRNPNQPNKLAIDWPQFTTEKGHFLQFKSGDTKVIDTPNKERNDRVIRDLFSARRRQVPLDLPDTLGKTTFSASVSKTNNIEALIECHASICPPLAFCVSLSPTLNKDQKSHFSNNAFFVSMLL